LSAGFFTFPVRRGKAEPELVDEVDPPIYSLFHVWRPQRLCTGYASVSMSARHAVSIVLQPAMRADIVPAGTGGAMKMHWEGCGLLGRAAFFVLAGVAVAMSLAAGPAGAEGALAVGIARGGTAKGYATGFAYNQPTVKAARSNAVEQCKKTKSSNADAKSGCEVVVTFHNKCVASAVDPQQGTPGAGWGVGPSQQAADGQALARCRAKAGSERAEFCEVTDRYCDGK
jgi:hypothetical protein